ncbi:hypothetical protein NliqN6_5392 [Naganishia liquefaciens]|uniref:Uncharacterized protein n=1 Tax=Naganishia liquefaciens TaxID=104408 RepID=A0A8H3YGL5_9TREE|nr:hypothetical protein NliqN6_5392 [Naganishia liquefaciens]
MDAHPSNALPKSRQRRARRADDRARQVTKHEMENVPPEEPPHDDDDDPNDDDDDGEMTYEEQRLATIRANEQLLKELGLVTAPSIPRPPSAVARSGGGGGGGGTAKRTVPKRSRPATTTATHAAGPIRKSARLSAVQAREDRKSRPRAARNPSSLTSLSGAAGSGSEFSSGDEGPSGERAGGGRQAVTLPPGERLRIPVQSVQYAAVSEGEEGQGEDYSVVQPLPTRQGDGNGNGNGNGSGSGAGRLIFKGPFEGVFVPNLTPEEVLRGGAFGGNYYADTYSSVLKRSLNGQEDVAALPSEWTREDPSDADANRPPFRISTHLTAPERDPAVNRYGVAAGQGLKEWEKSGWIWQGDPRGWMQWYVRFYQGRRCEDDERQVQRWLNLAGPTGRFSRMLMKKIAQHPGSGGAVVDNTAVEDENVGRVLRQVCWQWGLVMDREEWRRRIEGAGL